MKTGTFTKNVPLLVVWNADESKIVSVGGSKDSSLCKFMESYVAAGDEEIMAEVEVNFESDGGCVTGPPDGWEQPFYSDDRTIVRMYVEVSKDKLTVPFHKGAHCTGAPKEVQDAIQKVIDKLELEE